MSDELALWAAAGIALLMLGAVAYVAHRRQRSVLGWFLLALLITVPLALLALIALPVRGHPSTPARRALGIGLILVGATVVLAFIGSLGYDFSGGRGH
jgi:hypothetical protein